MLQPTRGVCAGEQLEPAVDCPIRLNCLGYLFAVDEELNLVFVPILGDDQAVPLSRTIGGLLKVLLLFDIHELCDLLRLLLGERLALLALRLFVDRLHIVGFGQRICLRARRPVTTQAIEVSNIRRQSLVVDADQGDAAAFARRRVAAVNLDAPVSPIAILGLHDGRHVEVAPSGYNKMVPLAIGPFFDLLLLGLLVLTSVAPSRLHDLHGRLCVPHAEVCDAQRRLERARRSARYDARECARGAEQHGEHWRQRE